MTKTVTDIGDLLAEKNLLTNTDAWVWLFYIDVDGTDFIAATNNSESVTFDGVTYSPFPMVAGELVEDSEGNLTELELIVSNIDRTVSDLLDDGDLIERDVTIRGVNLGHLASATNCLEQTCKIKNAVADEMVASFTLGFPNFHDTKFPSRRFIRSRCPFIYEDADTCGYSGALATCEHTLAACQGHDNESRFGGHPGIPKRYA